MPVNLILQNYEGEINIIGNDLIVEPQGVTEAKFLIILNKENVTQMKTPLSIAVTSHDKILDIINTSFLGKVAK